MYSYNAYGLEIASSLCLPELIEQDRRRPDVIIRLDAVSNAPAPRDDGYASGWVKPNDTCFTLPRIGTISIRDGSEIIMQPAGEADDSVCRLYLLGPAIAMLLHQRGLLVLHASAIVINGRAVAFMAEKGEGKSTMAASLRQRGHPLLADDIVALDMSGEKPLAFSGFPQLKLWPEAAEQTGAQPANLPRVSPDQEKRACRIHEGFHERAIGLDRVMVLASGDHDAITALPPQQAFMNLVKHCYTLPMLKDGGALGDHFRQAMLLAKQIPILQLTRRRDLSRLGAIAEMVESCVEPAEGMASSRHPATDSLQTTTRSSDDSRD